MHQRGVIAVIGTTQTLAWASSYYLPAILAAPIARALGVSEALFFGCFTVAMVLAAFLGPRIGRAIDTRGGRPVLATASLLFALGLATLAAAQGPLSLLAAWCLLGVAMAMGLYEAGFATLAHLYGREARSAITGVTLIAGFASTVGWPATAALEAAIGWRGACLVWAALHLALALPLHLLLPRMAAPRSAAATAEAAPPPRGTAGLLAIVFALAAFVTGAMSAHLPALLVLAGATPAAAIAAGALIGPAQVAARVLEFGFLRRFHPIRGAALATIGHPLGAALFLAAGPAAAAPFALLYGASNGLLTIARGALPLALFGPAGYGARQGAIVAPARLAQAFAPMIVALLITPLGVTGILVLTTACSLAALALLARLATRLRG
jgi:MFS family permease